MVTENGQKNIRQKSESQIDPKGFWPNLGFFVERPQSAKQQQVGHRNQEVGDNDTQPRIEPRLSIDQVERKGHRDKVACKNQQGPAFAVRGQGQIGQEYGQVDDERDQR